MHCPIRRFICLSLVMLLSVLHGSCLAEDPWEFGKVTNPDGIFYTSDPRQLYNAQDSNYKSQIVWTIMHDEREQKELHLLKCISLENGEVREWTINNEYIIQKDPDEYDGVLYAIEDDEEVQIWLAQPDGQREQLASYTITYPYWENGPQTVRAYMHGTLYYIRSLEKVSPEEADKSFHAAVLCSIDAEGNEYTYQLNNDANPAGALFHYFAISPYGKVAWVTASRMGDYRTNAKSILVETPGQGMKSVLPEGIEEQLGWDIDGENDGRIYGQSLCWIDENHLMFGGFAPSDSSTTRAQLYMLQTDSQEVEPLLNADGNPVVLYHSIQGASCVYYNREENLIAYLGSPTSAITWDLCNDAAAVPHIIDLNTGRNYVLYQIQATAAYEGEFRNQTGQLSWSKSN